MQFIGAKVDPFRMNAINRLLVVPRASCRARFRYEDDGLGPVWGVQDPAAQKGIVDRPISDSFFVMNEANNLGPFCSALGQVVGPSGTHLYP